MFSGGAFSFSVIGLDGLTVVIETSSDLRNWQPAATNILSGGSADIQVLSQTLGPQFFRARPEP
jgi:hypothetical protein